MNVSALFILFFSFIVGQASSACGPEFGAIKPGNKVLGVEFKEDNKSKWVMDDDGIFGLAMVAGYCYQDISRPEVKIDEGKKRCAQESQEKANLKWDEKIDYGWYDKDYLKKAKAISVLKSECGLDTEVLWNEALEKVNILPLSCVEEVRGIAKKVAFRSAEYLKEQSDPKYLATVTGTDAEKKEFIAGLTEDRDRAASLAAMFSESPVKAGKFLSWLDGFPRTVERHGYQMVSSPDSKFDPESQVSLSGILVQIGVRLPGLIISMCGHYPKEALDALKTAVWDVRASGSGTQGGVK